MLEPLLREILKWSEERPAWQRDALRRLFTTGDIGPNDVADLVELCKAARGLSEPRASQVLTEKHLAIKGAEVDSISLLSLTHHSGVNALAPKQTITFGPSLTVVYGPNTAGKSGYTRILKRACRSRFTEDILGNVLSEETPLKPQATIRFRVGGNENSTGWTPDAAPSEALAAVSVFDVHCAPVYLRDKTDVAFRPLMITVEHAPGGSSPVHRHNAHAMVYVLEGSVVMQVKGGKQVTLTAGRASMKAPTMFMSLTGMQAVPSRRNFWWS